MAKKKHDYRRLLYSCKERMPKLLAMDAPDVILTGEARLMLSAIHGGAWAGIRSWIWHEVCRALSNIAFDIEVCWYRIRYGDDMDTGADRMLDRKARKDAQKHVKKGGRP